MLLKTVIWTALCLSLCGADQIRILNSGSDIQDDPVAQHAFKSKIRSLTLKSSIERALSDFVNDHSGHHKTAKKEVTETHLAAAGFGNANATSTTNIYEASPPETTPLPTTTTTTGPYVTPPGSGCYRLVPCCCNDTQPYVTPKPPCSGGYPSPPSSYQPSPIDPVPAAGPPCSSCCSVAVSTPCYFCPCLSQCSIVPASSCPCDADFSVEYQCPNVQPQGILLNELSDWINQGYRLLENLRTPPACAYAPGGIPALPPGYNTQPHQSKKYVSNYNAEHLPNFVGLKQEGQQADQSPNVFPFRQLRQRSFSQQGGYIRPGYQPGPIFPYPPVPQPGYAQPQPGPQPYPLPPSGGYPIFPPVRPVTSQYPTATTTTTASSGAVYLISTSAVAVSLIALLATAFLIK